MLPQPTSYDDALREYGEIADKLNLPGWLRFKYLEDHDADRILEWNSQFLLRVDHKLPMILDLNSGCWLPLRTSSLKAQAVVRSAIMQTRNLTADQVYRWLLDLSMNDKAYWEDFIRTKVPCSASHVSRVVNQLSQRILTDENFVQNESSEEFDDRNRRPVIPIIGRGAIDFTQSDWTQTIMTAEMAEMRMTFHGWVMPVPEPDILDSESEAVKVMQKVIDYRYSEAMISRIARHLLGVGKHIDVICAPQADWGKSTLITLCERAFPGMIGRVEAAKALSAQGTKFSQIETLLTSKLIVFIDEGGEEPAVKVRPGALKTLVDDNLSVELKGENRRTVKRVGTAVFVGHDWPWIDTSAQGMAARFKWAYKANDVQPMSQAARDIIVNSKEAVDYFRYRVLQKAHEIYHAGDPDEQTNTIDAQHAVSEFIKARFDPFAIAVQMEYEIGDKNDFVPTAQIRLVLEGVADEEKVKPADIRRAMNGAFPGGKVKATSKKIEGKAVRGWLGIRSISSS